MHALRKALVRRPGARLAEGLVTHVERRPVDVELAAIQWAAYVAALEEGGWAAAEVSAIEGCPDSVFVEDTMVLHGGLAVIARPGAQTRRPELAAAEEAVRALGYPVERIEAPGTLDGGDVLATAGTVYVGVGGRTNTAGARQLRELLETTVVEVPIAGVLHLKTAVTTLPDGSVVGYTPLVPHAFPGFGKTRFRPVPEPSGAQVVVLDERTLLLAADCPRSAELFAGLGYDAIMVDIGEFQKLEGCVTCLSVLSS
ncbi:MAG TPA: N(G),N(G)-dimethylarginine dimethylaminohydrolase [Gaiellaceae bacterium]|nr:N(G),N(G)-dimethylarginine dimethylaminohydrolase [Gaiellaceae bacterium]